MLMAYEDLGFKIRDISADDPRIPLYPIEKHPSALRIIAQAETERPDLKWAIQAKNGKEGPFRVVGTPKS